MSLQTAANSAAPYRKRIAVDQTDAKGHAAGVLFVAPDGDVLLLRRSSKEANYSGHWALPGGGVESGETPEQGAIREGREEMGVDAQQGTLKPLDQRRTPTGMVFHTFARPVGKKFVPRLNDEHSGYAWAPLDQLPRPIHPAVEATLRERVGMADDMSPEDWSGLRDGFLKWTLEEERETEHAQDSATMALDRDSVRTVDGDGRLHISITNISKATVNPYRGREIPDYEKLGLDPDKIYNLLRDPAELEKAAPTFNGIQVLRKHIPVNAEDHQPYDVIGATGNECAFESPYLKNSMVIWVADDIHDIESEVRKELSSAYRYRAEMTPGRFDGIAFDGVMRDIVGNHVALVKDGRAGPDVVVGDSRENLDMKATRFAVLALRHTAAALAPLMAMDAKPITLNTGLFRELTRANYNEKRPALIEALTAATKGKLAQDADLSQVVELLDAMGGAKAVDEVDPAATEASMQTAGTVSPVTATEAVDSEMDGLKGFLKEKGMGEDDINTACGMVGKKATDAAPENETPEEKAAREAKEKTAKDEADAKVKKDEDEKKAKDAAMKDMVTKPAMDAAINTAVESTAKSIRNTERGIRTALADVRPWVGELSPTLALDSADDVYRHAAELLQIPDAKTIHASALPTIIRMQPKPGARPVDTGGQPLAMDAAQTKDFSDRFPAAGRIGAA